MIIISSYLSPQFKYMNFHIFICIPHHLRVYYQLTTWPAPSWLADSLVGRASHRYRRGHGFESRSGLNFFQALISQFTTAWSCVLNCDDQPYLHIWIEFYMFDSPALLHSKSSHWFISSWEKSCVIEFLRRYSSMHEDTTTRSEKVWFTTGLFRP